MSRLIVWTMTASVVSFCLLSGCDRPPSPPRTVDGHRVKVVAIAPESTAEREAVTAAESERVNYRYRLGVLQAYYEHIGNMDKYNWTRREMKNLDRVQTFSWEGIPGVAAPEGESIEGADERLLVEYLISARRAYIKAMADLAGFYRNSGDTFKAELVNNMQVRFDPIRTYMYFLDAETPSVAVKPTDVIPEADEMFERAYKLFRKGKGFIPLLTTSYAKERKALVIFRELIRKYPQSTKVALAAYYVADIYKEYFHEYVRAVHWYRQAWRWDPTVTEPARFQAATVYDFHLSSYARAVECYRLAIQHEQFNASNVRYAHQRLRELTEKQKAE